MEGCPWSFNRRALIMARMKEGDNPRSVELNKMDLWVQVYDLKAGMMTERIIKEVGNYIGTYVRSCPSNFVGGWRDYLRVRVLVDVLKPLKRRMKVRKAGGEWDWINFKYENVPTFCFICGLQGHSDKFCRLFVTKESDIVRPYGEWMRATFRRQVKPIGAKWLRNGNESAGQRTTGEGSQNPFRGSDSNHDPNFTPENQGTDIQNMRDGRKVIQNFQKGGTSPITEPYNFGASITPVNTRKEVVVIESKKRRTESTEDDPMGFNTEVMMDSDEEENVSKKQTGPTNKTTSKNGLEASTQASTRLAL